MNLAEIIGELRVIQAGTERDDFPNVPSKNLQRLDADVKQLARVIEEMLKNSIFRGIVV
jgi:L-asparaginase/Glu-tRNA(Gln) amidotransferase subunit D